MGLERFCFLASHNFVFLCLEQFDSDCDEFEMTQSYGLSWIQKLLI